MEPNIDHLRLWLSPMRYKGMPVYIGRISHDIGVKGKHQKTNKRGLAGALVWG